MHGSIHGSIDRASPGAQEYGRPGEEGARAGVGVGAGAGAGASARPEATVGMGVDVGAGASASTNTGKSNAGARSAGVSAFSGSLGSIEQDPKDGGSDGEVGRGSPGPRWQTISPREQT